MSIAKTPTLLSLDEWATQLGMNPLFFNGAVTSTGIFALKNDQQPIWHQYEWQASAQYSRERIAALIAKAEQDIASLIGYYPAPMWINGEVHQYTQSAIKLNWGKLILAGRRATTLIATGNVTYSDPDGDGFDELATIVVATTITDECALRLFFVGHSGERQWEVRPLKDVVIAGGNATITVDSWMLFKPELWERIPNNDVPAAILADDSANYVATIEVRTVQRDPAGAQAVFYWNCSKCGGSSCGEGCEATTEDACVLFENTHGGLVVPVPATYDADTEVWTKGSWSGRRPDYVKFWYLAGEQENLYLEGAQCRQLSYDMARLISILAASRIDWFFGGNNNVQAFADYWRADTAETPQGGSQFFIPTELARNPLGTRRGELEVFKTLGSLRDRVYSMASAL